MCQEKIEKKDISNKLVEIIEEISGIKVKNPEECLFDMTNNLSAELFVYILLRIKDEFKVAINDDFVESLKNYSINDITESIVKNSSN